MATADDWFADLRSVKHAALSTIRGLQVTIRGFCEYLIDPAYQWVSVCQERFGVAPVQIINEANAAAHVADYEGHPARRTFTRVELVTLLEHVDSQASTRHGLGVKGWASAFRDSVILKVAYGYGTRRNETRMLDLSDLSANPHAPEFGSYGVLTVRYGNAQRGSPPKRRSVLTVWPWTCLLYTSAEDECIQFGCPSGELSTMSTRSSRRGSTGFEVGGTYRVPPGALVIGANVRSDTHPGVKDFAASIKARGVLEPITAWVDDDGNLVVYRGQRRTLAAASVGTPDGLSLIHI